jgi:hypothetical protein
VDKSSSRIRFIAGAATALSATPAAEELVTTVERFNDAFNAWYG